MPPRAPSKVTAKAAPKAAKSANAKGKQPARGEDVEIDDGDFDDDPFASEEEQQQRSSSSINQQKKSQPSSSKRQRVNEEEEEEEEEGEGMNEDDEADDDDAPASIPPELLTRIMHEFFEKDGTRISKDANAAAAKYIDIFVRETIARAAVEKDGGFIEVEDLEKIAPQILLDL